MISPLTSGLMVTWTTGWILPLATTMLVRLWRATFSVWTVMTGRFFEDGHQRQRHEHQADDRKDDDFPAFF